ncbi:MAG TPA: hypothetical protein VEZ17_13250 [Chitinophagaceae bacterium]|jgi:hypothetical protein|nr:hypothetical protein [Chitinophagaceae bacterium]
MIPKTINRKEVLKAITKANYKFIPRQRRARHWAVLFEGIHYPVKLLISWAYEFQKGKEWDSSYFISQEAIHYLKSLGFTIISIKHHSN